MCTLRLSLVRLTLFFLLTIAASQVTAVGAIRGKVTEFGTGVPLNGITVQLYQSADPNSAGENAWDYVTQATTGSSGEYVLFGLGGLEARQYHINIPSGAADSDSGRHFAEADLYNVQVHDDAITSGVDLRLREAGLIWGFVRTESGEPIPNAMVVGHAEWVEDGDSWHWVFTDHLGSYSLWVLPSPGAFYRVSTQRPYLDPLGPGGTEYETQFAPGLYQATLAGVRGPDFALAEGGCIRGRIVNSDGTGIPNVEVDPWLITADGDILEDPDAHTDEEGYYTLNHLPAADEVYAFIDQWRLRPAVLDGVKYGSGRRFVGPLAVTPGSPCTPAPDMAMPVAGIVAGVVTDIAGTPVVGAEIEIRGFDEDGYELGEEQIFTDSVGQYTLDFVPPGKYSVWVSKEGWVRTNQTNVLVSSGELTDVDLVMHEAARGAAVSGQVIDFLANTCRKDGMGNLLPGYQDEDTIRVCGDGRLVLTSGDRSYREQDLLDIDSLIVGFAEVDDGYAEYFQPDPTETIGAYDTALSPGVTDAVLFSFHNTVRGGYVVIHDSLRWDLAAGETLADQNLHLPSGLGTGTIEGDISYPAGTRFNPQRTLIIANTDSTFGTILGSAIAFPEFAPSYRIGNLPPGGYTLQVISDGFVTQTYGNVIVASGATTVQDIHLITGTTLEGIVTDEETGGPVVGARIEITVSGKDAVSDAAGTYSISGLAAGDHALRATKPGYAGFGGMATVAGVTSTFDIALDSVVGSIAGRVEDGGGTAINGANVVAFNPDLHAYETGITVDGGFSIGDLPAGDYVLGIEAPGYGPVQFPPSGMLTLAPDEALVVTDPIVLGPIPPSFGSTSSVSDTTGTKTLSATITSDQDLASIPTIDVRGLETPTGCDSFDVEEVVAGSKYDVICVVATGETLVWIDVAEGPVPVIVGEPAKATFSFEVATDLLATSTTNFFNAEGGDSTIMGTQDNTKVYVPPFALTGAGGQAVTLTVKRYGSPGGPVADTTDHAVSAVYDFAFEDDGVQIDLSHSATVTLQFEKPADMTEEEFERDLRIAYFRVTDQQWVYHDDPASGISNVHISWLNSTVTFDANHFTRFAAFLPVETTAGDLNGDGCVDRGDYAVLLGDIRDGAPNDPAYDLNEDGAVNRSDVRTLMGLFTNPRGISCF